MIPNFRRRNQASTSSWFSLGLFHMTSASTKQSEARPTTLWHLTVELCACTGGKERQACPLFPPAQRTLSPVRNSAGVTAGSGRTAECQKSSTWGKKRKVGMGGDKRPHPLYREDQIWLRGHERDDEMGQKKKNRHGETWGKQTELMVNIHLEWQKTHILWTLNFPSALSVLWYNQFIKTPTSTFEVVLHAAVLMHCQGSQPYRQDTEEWDRIGLGVGLIYIRPHTSNYTAPRAKSKVKYSKTNHGCWWIGKQLSLLNLKTRLEKRLHM